MRTQGPAGAVAGAAAFAGGSFWKRFDKIEGGRATGSVVNYDMEFLPGDPEVQEIDYPDDNRLYFKKGDRILLLKYRNDPYKIVYDTIKVIDENNAIGVMHLGEFPNGVAFSAFVMARHNYPLERMSLEDHTEICALPAVVPAALSELAGAWTGGLVPNENPGASLLRRLPPVPAKLAVEADGKFTLTLKGGVSSLNLVESQVSLEARRIDTNTIVGRALVSSPDAALLSSLRHYGALEGGKLALRFLLNRG